MDLFEYARELNKDKESPLAGRMRPATLDEVVDETGFFRRGGRSGTYYWKR